MKAVTEKGNEREVSGSDHQRKIEIEKERARSGTDQNGGDADKALKSEIRPESKFVSQIESSQQDDGNHAAQGSKTDEERRKNFLRKLFQSAKFRTNDGLDDYNQDFRKFKSLGNTITSDMRHQMNRKLLAQQEQEEKLAGSSSSVDADDKDTVETSTLETNAGDTAQGEVNPESDKTPSGVLATPFPGAISKDGQDRIIAWSSAEDFHYRPALCAHVRSGVVGCKKCMEACPAGAIGSDGNLAVFNRKLCRGNGICATVCPSEAITRNPQQKRKLLKQIRQAPRKTPGAVLIFHDNTQLSEMEEFTEPGGASVVLVRVETFGSIGMDILLDSVAHGAGPIFLVVGGTDSENFSCLSRQLELAGAILIGMGFQMERFHLISDRVEKNSHDLGIKKVWSRLRNLPKFKLVPCADFELAGNRRERTLMAVDYLFEHSPKAHSHTALAPGAHFGGLLADRNLCTLCKACVGACPTGALMEHKNSPSIRFRERDCVQCGLCALICPEKALRLNPRMVYDSNLRNTPRILVETEPFYCVNCGTAFATEKMIKKVEDKLSGNPMYKKDNDIRRLRMCGQCRIKDLHETSGKA